MPLLLRLSESKGVRSKIMSEEWTAGKEYADHVKIFYLYYKFLEFPVILGYIGIQQIIEYRYSINYSILYYAVHAFQFNSGMYAAVDNQTAKSTSENTTW